MALTVDKSLRLPDGEYFGIKEKKSGICIHHTVGGSAKSSFNWWLNDGDTVGTAYLIARDGTIHEVFDPECWAWQFGLNWNREDKIRFEKRFIGIEIASEGSLKEQDGKFYCFDKISPRTEKDPAEVFDYGKVYRGFRYFDKYEQSQVDSLIKLINHLCITYQIERIVPADYLEYYGEKLQNYRGIIGHVNVRNDKSDPMPDTNFWQKVISGCNLEKANIIEKTKVEKLFTEKEIDQLFENNIQELNKMYVPAGSMVKGLIMELARGERKTYIKLANAKSGGHKVNYEFIQGDRGLVLRIAGALGFKQVTENSLEVRSA